MPFLPTPGDPLANHACHVAEDFEEDWQEIEDCEEIVEIVEASSNSPRPPMRDCILIGLHKRVAALEERIARIGNVACCTRAWGVIATTRGTAFGYRRSTSDELQASA